MKKRIFAIILTVVMLMLAFSSCAGCGGEKDEEKTDKETKKTYTYYNEKGEVIGTFESKLSYVGGNEDYLLLTGYALDKESNSNVLKTYKFTITK